MKKEVPRENVAQFYFPGGKPISKEQKQKNEQAIEKAFKEDSLTLADFEPVIKDVCGAPTIFRKMLFEYIKKSEKLDEKAEKIPKQSFISFFKREFENEVVGMRTFKIIAQIDPKNIVPDDFKPLFKYLLETHPGLEFLQATPEF